MTDEEYVFRHDIADKKSAGHGAFHQKCGSKSKKCSLPSDYLTKGQLKKMSGECKTFDLNKWYSWEEFKNLPENVQVEYIQKIVDRYHVGLLAIEHKLFHVSSSLLLHHLQRRGYVIHNIPRHAAHESVAAFERDVNSLPDMGAEQQKEPVPVTLDDESTLHVAETAQNAAAFRVTPDHEDQTPVSNTIPWQSVYVDPERIVKAPDKPHSRVNAATFEMDGFDMAFFQTIAGLFSDRAVRVSLTVEA